MPQRHYSHKKRAKPNRGLFRLAFTVCSLTGMNAATTTLRGVIECNEGTSSSSSTSGCATIIATTEKAQLELSEAFVNRAVVASELSFLSYEDDISKAEQIQKYRAIYDDFYAWYDGINDAALVVKQDSVCYGVFRGTNQASPFDMFQNLFPLTKEVDGTGGCRVRRGFYSAHYRTPYVDEFRQEVENCVKSCASSSTSGVEAMCPLVLTGQSQGASVSIVASLDPELKQYSPTTMAFGPLKEITNVDECGDYIDKENIYSFINVGSGVYDDAAYGNPYGEIVGHVLLLDENNAISYVGVNNNENRSPNARKIHAAELYVTRMQELQTKHNSVGYPITLTQWADGHWCTKNDECNSGNCHETELICTTIGSNDEETLPLRTSGSVCESDLSCESGACYKGYCTLDATNKLGMGAGCEESEDCVTGRCVQKNNFIMDPRICSPLRGIGMWCRHDVDCISNNCSGRWYFPYMDKRCRE